MRCKIFLTQCSDLIPCPFFGLVSILTTCKEHLGKYTISREKRTGIRIAEIVREGRVAEIKSWV